MCSEYVEWLKGQLKTGSDTDETSNKTMCASVYLRESGFN